MRVTRVNLRTELVERPGSRIVAVGSIILDQELMIEYVRVVRAADGRFIVAMPSLVSTNGQHKDVIHPISSALRKKIDAAVLDELSKKKPQP